VKVPIELLVYGGEVQLKEFLEGGKEPVIGLVYIELREDINPR
jgi:hypothetical protein